MTKTKPSTPFSDTDEYNPEEPRFRVKMSQEGVDDAIEAFQIAIVWWIVTIFWVGACIYIESGSYFMYRIRAD